MARTLDAGDVTGRPDYEEPKGIVARTASQLVSGLVDTWQGLRGVIAKGAAKWVRGQSPNYSPTSRNVRLLGWTMVPAVQACIRLVAETVATIGFKAYRKKADGSFELLPANHALQELLANPYPRVTAFRFHADNIRDMMVSGNILTVIERDNRGVPSRLRRVEPERMQIAYSDALTDIVFAYMWNTATGIQVISFSDDLIHTRDFIDYLGVFGSSRMASAITQMATDSEATKYVRDTISNYGVPALAISVPGTAGSTTKLLGAELAWKEKMVTRRQRGGAAFIPAEMKIHEIGFTMKDLEFVDLRKIAREDICIAAGVDPHMISSGSAEGKSSSLSGQQYEEARRALIARTCMPMIIVYESTLTDELGREYGDDIVIMADRDALADIQENEQETSTRTLAELTAGVISREEARQSLDREPEIPDTDTLVGSSARVEYVAGTAIGRGAAMGATPPEGDDTSTTDLAEDPADPATTPKEPVPDEEDPAKKRTRDARAMLVRQGTLKAGRWDALAASHEVNYFRAASNQFKRETQAVKTLAAGIDNARAEGDTKAIADFGDALRKMYKQGSTAESQWRDVLTPLNSTMYDAVLRDIKANGGAPGKKVVAGLAGAARADGPLKDHRAKVSQARAARAAEHIGETTEAQMTAVITAATTKGMTFAEVVKLVLDNVLDDGNDRRAALIARTETIGALNNAEFDMYRETGAVQTKGWFTAGDDRVRDTHEAAGLEGMIPIDDVFDATQMLYPGDPNGDADEVCNCRCVSVYGTSDDEN